MTREVLIDLCARLPYGVILLSSNGKVIYQTDGNTAAELLVEEGWKPYLRPMSSMTEEEEDSLAELNCYYNNKGLYFSCGHSQNDICDVINFLNSHHFDYRGLIERELAIDVTEENNPYKE